MSQKAKIFLGLPTYDGSRFNGLSLVQAMPYVSWQCDILSSSLAFCFNKIWCEMLNLRDDGKVTHFAMLHADVVPKQRNYVELLFNELQAYDADVMSTIIAIKNDLGLTSTGYDTDDLYRPHRLVMRQAMEMDETWTHDRLVFNTGLWIADVRPERGDWPERICFKFQEKIVKENGRWEAKSIPEDWDFSRQCRALGLSTYVTRKVKVRHIGKKDYDNDTAWGTALVDPLAQENDS